MAHGQYKEKQWGTYKNHHGCSTPYQRNKIKQANPINNEEARAIDKVHNRWKRFVYERFNNPAHAGHIDHRIEEKALMDFVGHHIEEYEEFFSKRTSVLRDKGIDISHRVALTQDDRRWHEFYVDDEGIIRYNGLPSWRKKRAPLKYVIKEDYVYFLDQKKLWEYPEVDDIFRNFLPEYYEALTTGISKERYEIIRNNSYFKSDVIYRINKYFWALNESIRKEWLESHKSKDWWRTHCINMSFDDFWYSEDHSEYRYVEPYTDEWYRIMAEQRDQNRKVHRELLKEKEEYNSVLLESIMEQRKAKEDELNRQKIDKHGFDENESFRGEEYHGQKRKRKPRHADVENHEMFLALQDMIEKTW